MMQESNIELSEWLAYYNILVEDIRYAKNQQWRLTYYITLLLAATIGLSELLKVNSFLQFILLIVAILLCILGIGFLSKFQTDLIRYRKNISKIRKKFPKDLKEIAEFKLAEGDVTYYRDFLRLQKWVIIIGTIFVVLVLIFRIFSCL